MLRKFTVRGQGVVKGIKMDVFALASQHFRFKGNKKDCLAFLKALTNYPSPAF